MLDTARVVGAKARSQTVAQQLLVSLEATAAIKGWRSLDPVYDFDGLVKKLDNDVVYQWDSLVRKMSAKTSETSACCGSPRAKRMSPVSKGAADRDKARAKKMIDDLNKGIERAERRRAAADLAKFADTPARTPKSDVRAALDSFDAVLSKKKPTTTDVESLFTAQPLDPKEIV